MSADFLEGKTDGISTTIDGVGDLEPISIGTWLTDKGFITRVSKLEMDAQIKNLCVGCYDTKTINHGITDRTEILARHKKLIQVLTKVRARQIQ